MDGINEDNYEFENSPSFIHVSVVHKMSVLFSGIWLFIIADLLKTDRKFKMAIRNLRRVGDKKKVHINPDRKKHSDF